MENTFTITPNEAFKSLEIAFTGKPSEAVRDALKALKFRWHGVKKIWYGYTDEETVKTAIENAMKGIKTATKTKTAPVAEKVNKYGVKVGDIFSMSWGYEQTNVDFFQVVKVCGETSVRVREVSPEIINRDGICWASENRTYKIVSDLIAPDSRSVFINDQTNGDIKRVSVSGYNNAPYIKVGDHYAHRVENGEYKTYVSWYH